MKILLVFFSLLVLHSLENISLINEMWWTSKIWSSDYDFHYLFNAEIVKLHWISYYEITYNSRLFSKNLCKILKTKYVQRNLEEFEKKKNDYLSTQYDNFNFSFFSIFSKAIFHSW